jgi:hypothetical protein
VSSATVIGILDSISSTHQRIICLWRHRVSRDAITPGWSTNRKLSSDALYLEVLYEVCELKTSVFRPPKLSPLSILI